MASQEPPQEYYIGNSDDYDIHGNPVPFSGFAEPSIHYCKRCRKPFHSGNKLHSHLKSCNSMAKPLPSQKSLSPGIPVVHSLVAPTNSKGYEFRKWRYAVVLGTLHVDHELAEFCADSGCGMSLVDRDFLTAMIPTIQIRTLEQPVKVRGVGSQLYDCSQWVLVDLYMPGRNVRNEDAIAHCQVELHVVENLNILIGNDILGPQNMDLCIQKGIMRMGSTGIEIPMTIKRRGKRVDRNVSSSRETVVPPRSTTHIPINYGKELPSGRNYTFFPKRQTGLELGPDGGLVSHVVNANFSFVQMRNSTDYPVLVPRRFRLGKIQDFEEGCCYFVQTIPSRNFPPSLTRTTRNNCS